MKNPVCKGRRDETGIFNFAMFTVQQMDCSLGLGLSFATEQFLPCSVIKFAVFCCWGEREIQTTWLCKHTLNGGEIMNPKRGSGSKSEK